MIIIPMNLPKNYPTFIALCVPKALLSSLKETEFPLFDPVVVDVVVPARSASIKPAIFVTKPTPPVTVVS